MHSAQTEGTRPSFARRCALPNGPPRNEMRLQRVAIRAMVVGRVRVALRECGAQQICPVPRQSYSRRLRLPAPRQLSFAVGGRDAARPGLTPVPPAAPDAGLF